MPQLKRNLFIGGSVVLFHLAAIWALQSGLLRRTMEVVVPAAILSDMVSPRAPKAAEPAPATPQPRRPEIRTQPPAKKEQKIQPATSRPPNLPVASPQQSPTLNAPTGVLAAQAALPAMTAPVAPEPAVSPPSPAARFEAPTVDADYAANEDVFRPPAISARLGEYGTVLLRVTVGVNGQATQVEVTRSSGYPRLDNAAVQGARRLKFRPATRGGVPVEASYQLPVKYSEPK